MERFTVEGNIHHTVIVFAAPGGSYIQNLRPVFPVDLRDVLAHLAKLEDLIKGL